MTAGIVNGYAVVWDALSQDFSMRGASPRYEKIKKGALRIASDAVACVSHFRLTSFAFSSDGSLELGSDNVGLWFRATLPETRNGFGIRNGLTGGRCIGASVEIDERVARYDKAGGVEVVTSWLVVGIALVERPVYPQTRAWLEGDVPNDPQAKELQSFFNARNRRKPERMLIDGLEPLAYARSRGMFC
jgi:phage head maturation protease